MTRSTQVKAAELTAQAKNTAEALDYIRKAYRKGITRVIKYVSLAVLICAVIVGVWFLWKGVVVAGSVVELLWELAIVVSVGFAFSIGIVLVVEGRTRVQQGMMPGADENHSLVDWIGRVVQSRSEKRKPLETVPEQLQSVEDDPTAIAILVGLGSIGSAIRALGRYILMALLFLAIAWSLAPFAASLAP